MQEKDSSATRNGGWVPPSTTPESVAMAKDLKKRGWSFVGPTTCYAFMQSMGLVNDHVPGCHVRAEVDALRAQLTRPS
ncbi:MAG: DNA-3-methyladenine glycosylase I [Actinomycetota bacterium]